MCADKLDPLVQVLGSYFGCRASAFMSPFGFCFMETKSFQQEK